MEGPQLPSLLLSALQARALQSGCCAKDGFPMDVPLDFLPAFCTAKCREKARRGAPQGWGVLAFFQLVVERQILDNYNPIQAACQSLESSAAVSADRRGVGGR